MKLESRPGGGPVDLADALAVLEACWEPCVEPGLRAGRPVNARLKFSVASSHSIPSRLPWRHTATLAWAWGSSVGGHVVCTLAGQTGRALAHCA